MPGRRQLAAALRGGAFVYFTAWFDSQGGMCLYAADSREVLVAMAMTGAFRQVDLYLGARGTALIFLKLKKCIIS